MTTYHIISRSRGWAFCKQGATRALKLFNVKRDAVAHAKKFLKGRGVGLFIHDKNGRVEVYYDL